MQDPSCIVSQWFHELTHCVASSDVHRLTLLFTPHGWLRDHLVFEWNFRSLKGHKDIEEYLIDRLKQVQITNLHLEDSKGIPPAFTFDGHAVEAAFTFETLLIWGRGYVLLQEFEGTWKALSLYFSAVDLKGHEENPTRPSGYYDEHRKTWIDVFEEEKKRIEEDPHVIILGAAQNGLNVGARFRQMNIPTLLIDRSDRVGDNWRQRYPSLTLHTTNSHHCPLYTKFPSNWPKFTPKDKVACMLEQYSVNQDLVIWHRSTMLPTPSYDPSTRRWTVEISKDGEKVTLRPYHIILAIGLHGKPYVPPLFNAELFNGPKFHATDYKGPEYFANKNVVVVGASQTATDICQNLALSKNVGSVTMVQRSSLIVTSNDYSHKTVFDVIYPLECDLSNADLRFTGLPLGLSKELGIAGKDKRIADQKEMIEGLLKAGLDVNEGEEGAGLLVRVYQRLGGYSSDIGAANLIIKGDIKIKRGEPERFTDNGLVFRDGSFLQADAVIFATGYEPVKNAILPIFGDEIASKITPVWGFNEAHELRRTFSPPGHPGIWWAIGDLAISRYSSKTLGIQIKARLLDLIIDENEASNRCFL